MSSLRQGMVGIVMLAAIITGCQVNEVVEPQYPSAPPEYKMYDADHLNDESAWGISNTHDPSVFRDGDWYYVFSTDYKVGGKPKPGIMVRKSKDLIHWEWVGYALDGIPKPAAEWSRADNLWAPDVTKIKDVYYLYYSASRFGTNQSFIGMATSASIEGPWTDQGVVVRTSQGVEPNAIDPCIVTDADGSLWLAYGSFFGGIYISPLDPATGKLKEGADRTQLARRSASKSGAVEGSYIVYNADVKKYYLFVSYDSLSSNYNVRVGRSDSITGPYLDYKGHDMSDPFSADANEIGTKIMGGYQFGMFPGWVAPGHNSVLNDSGRWFIVHHARGGSDKNWSYLHVRTMAWTPDGWPVVSPERYAGEWEQPVPKSMIAGDWQRIEITPSNDGAIGSEPMVLLANGKIGFEGNSGSWKLSDDNVLTLRWKLEDGKEQLDTGKVLPAWDWEFNRPTLVFTGLSDSGVASWGKKDPDKKELGTSN